MKRLMLTLAAMTCLNLPASVAAENTAMLRANAACNAYANISRIANPDVVYEMCLNGAKESIQGRNSVCERKMRQFNEQTETLHGTGRAEYIEIAQAYRIGCNTGKIQPKTNSKGKQSGANALSSAEIKEQQDIQSYGTEIRNTFSRISAGAHNLTGQRCSVNIWFSQNGSVLSTKIKSGDNNACSYVLTKTKNMKLSPMTDSQYKAFRNTLIDFSF